MANDTADADGKKRAAEAKVKNVEFLRFLVFKLLYF